MFGIAFMVNGKWRNPEAAIFDDKSTAIHEAWITVDCVTGLDGWCVFDLDRFTAGGDLIDCIVAHG